MRTEIVSPVDHFVFLFQAADINDYLNVDEPTSGVLFKGMEGWNIMAEQAQRATSESPSSRPFDHQIVLLKILSVLELSGSLKWKRNFPKLLKRKGRAAGKRIKMM